jgi:transcriptional regulator GlxA family with amidase domain
VVEADYIGVVPLLTRLGGETGAKRLLTLLEILAVLSRDAQSCRLCATSSHVQHSAEDKHRIDRIYRYLSEHFRGPCPVGQVAQAIAMNERTFSRFFRRGTGRNFIEALLDLRLSYASYQINLPLATHANRFQQASWL